MFLLNRNLALEKVLVNVIKPVFLFKLTEICSLYTLKNTKVYTTKVHAYRDIYIFL